MNTVSFIGNLGSDVTLRDAGETKVASLFVIVNRAISKEKREELEANGGQTSDAIRVTVWGNQAESCAQYLAKGKKVGVTGRLTSSTFEKDGEKRYSLEVTAERVEFLTPANGNGNAQAQAEAQAAAVADGDDIPF